MVLKVNAICEFFMGMGFFVFPDQVIPLLNQNGRTTTRVFGASLISMGCISWRFATSRDVAVFNLIFHMFGGLALAVDAATYDESPFIPPAILHLLLSIGLAVSLMLPKTTAIKQSQS